VTNVELEDRPFSAIRYWIRLAAVAAALTFILIVVLTHLTLERSIVASSLTGIIVFSGFFFRSFGKDKEKYKRVSKSVF
jgi:lipopolysaccharide export LptBFGC system permease protein LptF